jgi:oligopeptide/dipeptide ABC transporter ATP-binding protein
MTQSTVPVVECDHVVQEFLVRTNGLSKGRVSAVADVSFAVQRGEIFAIVGETGSGKSTLARAIMRAPKAKSGRILINGVEISDRHTPLSIRQQVQMIFQDPFSALDPKWSVERIVTEPLATAGEKSDADRRHQVAVMLNLVGLSATRFAGRRPSELSGGQAQRVAIARSLVSNPDLVICDEPVTSLDVSIQAQILRLLYDLRAELNLTYLLIAHDLAVVQALADRTATMYLGKFCETGPTDAVFGTPFHPYTEALLSAIPPRPGATTHIERIRLLGEPPSPLEPPSGCRFHTRCGYAQDVCRTDVPELRELAPGHFAACHFPLSSSVMSEPVLRTSGNDNVTQIDY